jgi:phosphatidylserine/phosphatidylglycerophosphate/cardiolipin synthase-like enzyme
MPVHRPARAGGLRAAVWAALSPLLLCFGPRASAAPPLVLAESVPSQTTLDDPAIEDAADLWVAMLSGAKQSIDISEFYISPRADDPKARPGPDRLAPVLAAVEAAAARGVKVRILADAKFQKTYPVTLQRMGALPNIALRLYDLNAITGGVQHAKYFIVDGERAWVGSQNFDWRSLDHIHELGVAMADPSLVNPLSAVFSMDWALAGGEPPPPPIPPGKECTSPQAPMPWVQLPFKNGEVSALFVASPARLLPPGVPEELPIIEGALDAAKQRVRLQLLSYAVVGYDKVEWRRLDEALRRAAARGVQVELVVADWSDKKGKIEVLQALNAAENIEVRFASIPVHSEGPIDFARVVHAKYLVIDGRWSWVGTSNWSRDYFEASRNVGLVVEGAVFAAELDRVFTRVWSSPYARPVPAGPVAAPAR